MPLQRSRGHSSLQRLAYIARRRLTAVHTGETFDYAARPDLLRSLTLVPEGCAEIDAVALWSANEAASKRPNAALGLELVLSLPMPAEFDLEASCRLAGAFVRHIIVEKHGLAATLAVHLPHGGTGEDAMDEDGLGPDGDAFARSIATASANLHCHVLVTPRQLTPDGLARRRYPKLDPVNRGGKTYGRHWGRLWGQFQNGFFADEGSSLRVTPNAPIALDPAPIKAVRRWRKRLRRDAPDSKGRALLVNQSREDENAAIALSLDDALAGLGEPITRGELERYFLRHLGAELATEMTAAGIGLGLCLPLAIPGSSADWFAGAGLIQAELAAFGRALMLTARAACRRPLEPLLAHGFAAETQAVLTALFDDGDLAMVEVTGAAELLAADIARISEAVGLTPVVIAHAAGHPPPRAVIRDIESLRTRMISEAMVIVDDADALVARELSLLLAAATAGRSRLVLIRRPDSDWARLPLLDLIALHAKVLRWRDAAARAAPAARRARPPAPPRSAITHALLGSEPAPEIEGWPRFALDPQGGAVTAPSVIAEMIRFYATDPGDLDWIFADRDRTRDEAGLARLLAQWPESRSDPIKEDRGHPDASEDPLAAEAAAFAMLEDAGPQDLFDDDPDPEAPSEDDFEFEGDDEPDFDGADIESDYERD